MEANLLLWNQEAENPVTRGDKHNEPYLYTKSSQRRPRRRELTFID